MKFQAVKGTRDFYPDIMRLRNWIVDTWKRVSIRNGFEEYDAPIFEYLDLFTIKSGDEIAEQLFNFTDRGGRNLAIRPEITPSLGRMVNAKINALPRPIKWFSVPRLCRAENPQKGRLREFFQWNIDIVGEDSELADAECVYVCVDALRELGLSKEQAQLRFSSRALLTEVLRANGIAEDNVPSVLATLDKRSKLPEEAFAELLAKVVPDQRAAAAINQFMDLEDVPQMTAEAIAGEMRIPLTEELAAEHQQLQNFVKYVADFGIGDWCVYDPHVVRGLAYYTGVVYEVFDRGQALRAVAGGGRYDNLLQVLGGPKVSATGFGMGDVVLGILLEERNLLPDMGMSMDFFVVDAEKDSFPQAMQLVSWLRQAGYIADYSFKRQNIGKQLKQATRRGARAAVIVGPEGLSVKNLSTGQQVEMTPDAFQGNPGLIFTQETSQE